MSSSSSPRQPTLRELTELVDKIGELNVNSIPQNRIFINELLEHVLVMYQQLRMYEIEKNGLDTRTTNIGNIIVACIEAANMVVKILKEEIENGRSDDKQSEYVFEREDGEKVLQMKTLIKNIVAAVNNSTITNTFEIHSSNYATVNGIVTPDEMINHARCFHSIGNEKCSGRRELLARTIHQLGVDDSKIKLVVVQGPAGVGKTNFSISLCRELKLLRPTLRLHLRLKSSTDFPLTTLEVMQFVVKTGSVGKVPNTEKEVRKMYHEVFRGRISVLLLEDPSSMRQILELLPNIRGSQSQTTSCTVVISSRSNLDLDFAKYTKSQIDKITLSGIEEKQARISDILGEEEEYDEEEEDEEENEEEENEEEDEIYDKKRQVVGVSLTEDPYQKFSYPKNFYVLYCPLQKLSTEMSLELLKELNNPKIDLTSMEGDLKSLSSLADNLPIFLKVALKVYEYDNEEKIEDFLFRISDKMDSISHLSYSRIRKLCHGFFITCFLSLPKDQKDLLLILTIWPHSFHVVDLLSVLNFKQQEKKLSSILQILQQFLRIGFLQTFEPLRFGLHSLVRETFRTYLLEEGGDEGQLVEEAKEGYYLHYFKRLGTLDNEHRFCGIEFTPGPERYEMELENMKCVFEFMRENEVDHISALNKCRYILRDRIQPIKRGQLYQSLLPHLSSSTLTPINRSEFVEGFSMVFYDLTDFNKSLQYAKQSLDEKKSEDPMELLSAYQLLGDVKIKMNLISEAIQCFEKIIRITSDNAREWQKFKDDDNDEDILILDNYYASAHISIAKTYLQKSDMMQGKRYFERGISTLKKIYDENHPELSSAYTSYAQILSSFKNKVYFDEIKRLFEKSIQIDINLFGKESRTYSEKIENYGMALLGQGNFVEAEKMLREAYTLAVKWYGENDIYIAGVSNNLAVCLKNLKRIQEAEQYYRKSLAIMQGSFGSNDYRVSVAKSNLAQCLMKNPQKSSTNEVEAQELFDSAVESLGEIETDESEVTTVMANMLSSMGDSMRERKEYEKSKAYFEKALALQKKITRNVDTDPEIAKTLISISKLKFDTGDYQMAETLQIQSLKILLSQYGQGHPIYTSNLTILANTKLKLRKLADAEKIYSECIELRKKNNESEVNNIVTYIALGSIKDQQKMYIDAEDLYVKALGLIRECKPIDQVKERSCLNALATILARQGKYQESESLYLEMIPFYQKEFGDESIEYGDIMFNSAAVSLHLNKYDDAEVSFSIAKKIFTEKLGDDHDRTRDVDNNLTEIRSLLYRRDQAAKCCGGCVIA